MFLIRPRPLAGGFSLLQWVAFSPFALYAIHPLFIGLRPRADTTHVFDLCLSDFHGGTALTVSLRIVRAQNAALATEIIFPAFRHDCTYSVEMNAAYNNCLRSSTRRASSPSSPFSHPSSASRKAACREIR